MVDVDAKEAQASIELQVVVPGTQAGGRITLETMVTLLHGAGTEDSASRPGSVLWSDRKSLALEGDAERFPVNVVNFEHVPSIDPRAGWVLHWPSGEFDEPFGASMRLLVNAEHEQVVDAVTTGSEDQAGARIRAQIHLDTARALIVRALLNDDFVEMAESFEEGTVGRVVADLLDQTWPGVDASTLANRMCVEPARFESALQSRFLVVE